MEISGLNRGRKVMDYRHPAHAALPSYPPNIKRKPLAPGPTGVGPPDRGRRSRCIMWKVSGGMAPEDLGPPDRVLALLILPALLARPLLSLSLLLKLSRLVFPTSSGSVRALQSHEF